MRYIFGNYEFDSEKLVLTQQGVTIDIRHNEAKVLQLLLEQSDNPLSKDDILSHVWQNKVVSDQAVFQNISHLRNIFGKEAIKTFSKRGYQWQLEFQKVADPAAAIEKNEVSLVAPQIISHKNSRVKIQMASVIGICFIALAVFFTMNIFVRSTAKVNISYITFAQTSLDENLHLEDSEFFNFTELNQLSMVQYDKGEELEYQAISTEHPLVLSGYYREFNQQHFLDFRLKGPYGVWQGQLVGVNKLATVKQLMTHLQQPFIYPLLTEQQLPETKQANLSLAHQQAPDDLIVLAALINGYIRLNENEKAMALSNKLINNAVKQNNAQYQGHAYLYQSTILTRKQLVDLSSHKLSLAIEKFEQVGDLKRQADAYNAQSWLDHLNDDYPAVKQSLLKSAELAIQANDIERELHALTYLSVLGHKHHQYDDKYEYLTQAENKMNAYQLPIYRFAKIPFHHAIYSDNSVAKEPHLKRVLEYTQLTPNHWVAQSSRQQLMRFYIKQKRLSDATALIENISQDNAKNLYLKTLLSQAKNEQAEFVNHAERTFELAQLSGDKTLSLDVSLMLCSSPSTQVNYDFYSQYINEYATAGWRRINEDKLIAIKL